MKALTEILREAKVRSRAVVWPLALALCVPMAGAQTQSAQIQGAQGQSADLPSAPMPNLVKLPGGVVVEQATPGALALSLDDAIARGEKRNLQMLLVIQNERVVRGQVLTVENSLLPSLTAKGAIEAQEINLAAQGFKGQSLAGLGLPPGAFSEIVKVDTASAQMSLNQQLFNVPAYYLYRSAQQAAKVANLTTLNELGGVTLAVGSQYLLALADASQIANAQALEKADEVAYQQAKASHEAGVGTNLDELRARVQLQTQQQALINDENAFAKDKIALNRLIGLPADQEITLTDTAPYAEFAQLPLEDAKKLAYERRKDLLSLQAQLEVAAKARKAVRAERLPVVSFDGYYGVLGEIGSLYHGVFTATGKVSVPVFQEGQLRGEREVAEAQVTGLNQQIDSLRVTIEQQIRAAMLDVQSSNDLVKVARSNVDLATQELQDASDRFSAGVDDNLPVVQAQATLAAAQSRLVDTLYQYNQSKLQLARNTGVVETQYRVYLGR
ncbi:TolC family protein [Tunturiibacter gelidoferens]|uniref:Outer membrane protein TolC n=1 Tax=Tunturiibacter lichenicola TaxID=2051959 RepID=A0A7Y9NJD4_9BACT|nr:TolC family protein [Edaphobacter lichenicola]NYF50388.1 outer membrane protein TolC [Edaphobacter lichenicola]